MMLSILIGWAIRFALDYGTCDRSRSILSALIARALLRAMDSSLPIALL